MDRPTTRREDQLAAAFLKRLGVTGQDVRDMPLTEQLALSRICMLVVQLDRHERTRRQCEGESFS
jgi:hypothetical protein